MSGTGGFKLDMPFERYNDYNAQDRTPDRIYGQPQMGMPGGANGEVRFGDPIDQPIFGFNPGTEPGPDIDLPPVFEPNPNGGGFNPDGSGKGGFPPPGQGIDPAPIQGGGGGGGSNGPGLDHLKDYGPVVDQMKQYVQSMSGLIDQINSKF